MPMPRRSSPSSRRASVHPECGDRQEVHGQIASILAAMEAATILEKRFEALARHDYLERLRAGEIDTEQKQKKLLDACGGAFC
ncbi:MULTISPECIES: hypothetical protein [Rhizobium]|uniref:hypothetical protein n=1 Tax=Rhizobium TaxID=379 RepID=UPI001142F893|nr:MULTISPECIES: hypothetical protein [Rhizobium]WET73680.1 hypothetical protein PYR68_20010 [Rhizobium croatiense]